MCGEWHFGVLGFPLVVLAAIGNMALAAVPVIYTNVHFCAAVLTEKQAGQRVDFPVPVGASDGCVFQNPLYGFKIAAADNRLMHIFCDVPLAPVYIVVMFIPEMLCSLEVDYIAAILLPCEDIGQGGFVPLAAVILVERLIFTGSPPAVFHVESGGTGFAPVSDIRRFGFGFSRPINRRKIRRTTSAASSSIIQKSLLSGALI